MQHCSTEREGEGEGGEGGGGGREGIRRNLLVCWTCDEEQIQLWPLPLCRAKCWELELLLMSTNSSASSVQSQIILTREKLILCQEISQLWLCHRHIYLPLTPLSRWVGTYKSLNNFRSEISLYRHQTCSVLRHSLKLLKFSTLDVKGHGKVS